MTIYQKVIAAFGVLRSSIMQRAEKSAIAPTFSESSVYSVGRLVYRGEALYRCTVEHSGEWNQSHFTETTIDEALSMKGDGGDSHEIENLYARDPVTGLYHLLTVDSSAPIKTLLVDQSGQSLPRDDDAYAKGTDGKWYKLAIETIDGISTLNVEQEGVEK